MGLDELPAAMGWHEAARLTRWLSQDPTSALGAALGDLHYAAPRAELLLADIHDVLVLANSDPKKGKPKPHPMRPVSRDDRTRVKPRRAKGVTDEQVIAAMAAAGHAPPI